MSQRGRGGGRGYGDSPQRGSSRGRGSGDRGGPSRGRGDGDRGGRGRGGSGDRGRGYGGPLGPGQQMQMASHPVPEGGGIYLSGQVVPGVDPEVQRREDALVEQTRGKTIDGFPGRRGYGNQGRVITLRTNYFKITTAYEAQKPGADDKLFRYDIDISPEPSKQKRRQFIEQLVQDPKFNGIHWATDYGKLLVTTSKLDLDGSNEWKPKLTLAPPSGSGLQQGPLPGFVQEARQRNTATVKVTFQTSYTLRDLIDYLRSPSSGAEYLGHETFLQLLNIIVYKPPQVSTTVANVGGNKFYPFDGTLAQIAKLGGGLQALRGYFSSVRPAIGRLLLNVNVTSGAFYEPIWLIQLLKDFGGTYEEAEVFIQTLKVSAEYTKDGQNQPFMTKKKTIVGLAKQPPPVKDSSGKLQPVTPAVKRFGTANEVKFRYRSAPNAPEREITVFDYFRTHHGITLQKPNVPVLNVGTRADPQYLPAELCTVLPGQAYRKLLAGKQTSDMITFAARPPNANAVSIAGTQDIPGHGLGLLRISAPRGEPDPQPSSVRPFGFRVAEQMLTVPGRILNSPKLMYNGQQAHKVTRGSWNLRDIKFRRPGKFDSWQVFGISVKYPDGSVQRPLEVSPRDREMLEPEALIERFAQSMRNYGIQMGTKKNTQHIVLGPLTKNNRAKNNEILADAFEKVKVKGTKQVILIILPGQERWLYSRIKFYSDVKYGIHTINAIGENIQSVKGQPMYFGNLALKFNIKGGGISHEVADTLVGPVGKNTIVFGIDVTHPSPGSSEGAPSIACVVANTDSSLFHWPGSIRTQKARQEMVGQHGMVSELAEMVGERLDLWRKRNNILPDRVVIYRDGVSEGQFKLILEQELPGFEEAYKKRYGDKPKWPKTAIIICGKRHHTRFYPTQQSDADQRSWNPEPGTVVDRGIVGRVLREFYLQAHQGLQGTAKPCHYSVIKDDIGFSADQLERFTLNLCYYFARCTKAVSVCPPAYYADLLAERGRAYLFSILQENHADDASSSDGGRPEWEGKGVHPDIAESTWYV